MPLQQIKVTMVDLGQEFHHHNRTYVLATKEERKRHPGNIRDGVLAYQLVSQNERIPVVFDPLEQVYIRRR
jgi:hypothetical protein